MALHSQLTDLPLQTALAAHPHWLREIGSPCHGYSAFWHMPAVRTTDVEIRDMLSYARLVVCEVWRSWLAGV